MAEGDSEQTHPPASPQRRRVNVNSTFPGQPPAPEKRPVLPPEYVPNGGATAAKQAVLYRLAQGWLTINDVTHLCCVARRTGEVWFERLGAVPFEQTGLPGNESRSRLVRRSDLENTLGDEGWRVVRSQQDEPQVLAALLGNDQYPLLSKLLSWSQETPRRKLPLLDLALELHLTPSDAAFDLNREIDWADQAGLIRDELRRTDRLAVATLSASRPRTVDFADLVTLEQWSVGKPFKDMTTRVLARQGKLEHLHGVVDGNGEVVVWLVPSWGNILKYPEHFTAIRNFELPNARAERTGERRALIDLAVESGTLRSYKWGRSVYIEATSLTSDEKAALEEILSDQRISHKIKQNDEEGRINHEQAKDFEQRLNTISEHFNEDEYHTRNLINISRMAAVARMKSEGQTLAACGDWLGVTRERVRQMLGRYERFVLAAASVEVRVAENLIENSEKSGQLPAYHQRLRDALNQGSKYALINQILIEHHVFSVALDALYASPTPLFFQQPDDKDLTVQKYQHSTVAFDGIAGEEYADQAQRLNALIEATLLTVDDVTRRRASVAVIREECDIALMAAKGCDRKEIARIFQLTSLDVQHILRRHQEKLIGLMKLEAQLIGPLSSLSRESNLPEPVSRILRHCQTQEPFALLNAMFVETEVLQTNVVNMILNTSKLG